LRSLREESTLHSMSIEFARTHVIGRSHGHSAVKAAAYRAGERLFDERTGLVADYSHRAGEVRHAEVLLPEGADPILLDRQALWAAVEDREDQHNRRTSAQLAKDHIIALPRELSRNDQVELARAFAQAMFVSQGLVVDLAVHDHSEGNPHAHLLTTTRVLEGGSFTDKAREQNGKFFGGRKISDEEQVRHRWASFQNEWFRARGIDAHVHNHDGQSYAAEVHLGPTNAMDARGEQTDRGAINIEIQDARTRTILANPSIVVDRTSDRKSLFTRHDLYRTASELVHDPEAFQVLRAKLDVEPSLKVIQAKDERGVVKEFLTTQKVLDLEAAIQNVGAELGQVDGRFELGDAVVEHALDARPILSEEQRAAAEHLTTADRISIVVGLAGAGKSTMLEAVRAAYEDRGHRVRGIALAGKAADELSHSAGIESRTIASWLMALDHERETIEAGDVYVMDEAGMVGNRAMKRVLDAIEKGGAKVVLVGDGEQLQSIQAGCPFRDLAKQEGYAEIGTIRRQRSDWQRQATKNLARGRAAAAVGAYQAAGHVHTGSGADMMVRLVEDYLGAGDASKTILAHRNKDVKKLNASIRERLKEGGELSVEREFLLGEQAEKVLGMPIDLRPGDPIRFDVADPLRGLVRGEGGTYLGETDGVHSVETHSGLHVSFERDEYDGVRHLKQEKPKTIDLAIGERVLFTKNDRRLSVKNGMLGTLIAFDGALAEVRTDDGATVRVDQNAYPHLAHGYATTVHKAQGMTVERAFLLGSGTMDKHLGYVSMSRHREQLDVYLPDEEFERRAFVSVISEARRQESALDLAREHGMIGIEEANERRASTTRAASERDAAPGEQTREVGARGAAATPEPQGLSVGQRDQEEDRADEREGDWDRERTPAEEDQKARMNRALLEHEFHVATQTMERAAAAHLVSIDQDNRAITDRLEQVRDEARAALEQHDTVEPRQGLFASKAKHEAWRETRQTLVQDLAKASFKADRHEREEVSDRVRNQVLAEARAYRELPKEVAIRDRRKRVVIGEKLLERLGNLEARRASARDEKAMLDIDREVARVVDSIATNAVFRSTLTPRQSRDIARSRTRSERGLVHDRSRGLER